MDQRNPLFLVHLASLGTLLAQKSLYITAAVDAEHSNLQAAKSCKGLSSYPAFYYFLCLRLHSLVSLVKIFKQCTDFGGFEIAVTLRHLAEDYSSKCYHQSPQPPL